MNQTSYRLKTWLLQYVCAWDQFWFTPRQPQTLSLLRVITGAMLLYSHLVLATDLTSFLGDTAWVNNETVRQLHDGTFGVAVRLDLPVVDQQPRAIMVTSCLHNFGHCMLCNWILDQNHITAGMVPATHVFASHDRNVVRV